MYILDSQLPCCIHQHLWCSWFQCFYGYHGILKANKGSPSCRTQSSNSALRTRRAKSGSVLCETSSVLAAPEIRQQRSLHSPSRLPVMSPSQSHLASVYAIEYRVDLCNRMRDILEQKLKHLGKEITLINSKIRVQRAVE